MSTSKDLSNVDNTPLHSAIRENRYQDVFNLLDRPCTKLDQQNEHGETPLFYSLKIRSRDALILALINCGCNVNIPNKYEETPLHLAAQRQEGLITYHLLRHGANINAKDNHGSTALHRAVAKGRRDNVHLLLDQGACVDEKNSVCQTAFSVAFYRRRSYLTDISRCLLNYVVDFNERDCDGFTPLHRALKNRSDVAIDIINRGANVNMLIHGKHCISYSLYYPTNDVFRAIWHRINFKRLLKADYYNIMSFLNRFFTDIVFYEDEFVICLYLLFKAPNINALIQQYLHADISERCVLFKTLRHFLPLEERIKIIYLLLSYGFEIYFTDISQIYHWCCGWDDTIDLLLNHGSSIQQNQFTETDRNIDVDLIVNRMCYDNFDIYFDVPDYELNLYIDNILVYQKFYKAHFEMDEMPKLACKVNPYRFYTVTEVPSLVQLSRDAFRAAVYKQCSTELSFKVYHTFSTLPVPERIKDILRLKAPIYD